MCQVISQRLDEQRKWFEEYRVSAQLHGSLRRDSGSDRGQEESQREEAVGGGSDAALFGRRLLQLEERLELLEHDSLLLLIEELRTDTRRQLRAEKKGRRAEANRQQQLVEALQSELPSPGSPQHSSCAGCTGNTSATISDLTYAAAGLLSNGCRWRNAASST